MSEALNKKEIVLKDHRCFCRGNPLLGKVGKDFYEFRNSSPRFFLRFYFNGTVEIGCRYCYRNHKFRLKDIEKIIKEKKNIDVSLDNNGN